jgi:hypothetical protein
MDNESIRKLLHLNDEEFKKMVEYQKKAEVATVLYCTEHELEYFDFEPGCYACIREKEELELAAKFLSEEIEKEKSL